MNKIASFVKTLRLKQLAIAFLAGVVLLLNTACAGSAQAKLPTDRAVSTDKTVDYDSRPVNQTQRYKGGMNNFDDTPPEQIPANKAKSLIDNAQRNVDSTDPRNAKLYKNPGYAAERTADELGGAAKARTNNAKESAKSLVDRGTTSIDRGTSNIKDNVSDAIDDAGYKSKQAAEDLKSGARRAVNAAKDAID